MRVIFFLLSLACIWGCTPEKEFLPFDLVVVGEGTGAAAASVAAARNGVPVLHLSHLPWIGGMLTAAGVSATDGNHDIAGGLWREFRDSLWTEYGGEEALFTGWVSKTCFEPKVGERVWQNIAKREEKLRQELDLQRIDVIQEEGEWIVRGTRKNGSVFWVKPKIIIDGTDLGDIAAQMQVPFDIGMEAQQSTREKAAQAQENNLIQDLTYVAILEPSSTSEAVSSPVHADRFHCSCLAEFCDDKDVLDCQKMLNYALLPSGKYMINWPRNGNDYFASSEALLGPTGKEIVHFYDEKREEVYQNAKQRTIDFVQYIRSDLGFDSLVVSQDAFGTTDGLAWMPYYREGRRVRGVSRLTLNEIQRPFSSSLYQYGIAVGDYPVDHHHLEKEELPTIDFPPIPSYNIPLGCLIPRKEDGLIMADKAISVSNLANGTTRLQPVIIGVGEAAGTLAALAIKEGVRPRAVPVRAVQASLIAANAYLMPYYDVAPSATYFGAIQRVGVTGVMRGTGEPFQWANRTWFYPHQVALRVPEVMTRLEGLYPQHRFSWEKSTMSLQEWKVLMQQLTKTPVTTWRDVLAIAGLPVKDDNDALLRGQLAVLIDAAFDPFHTIPITY